MRRAFVTLSGGRQVHYRRAGSCAPVVLLHATPDSSAAHEDFRPDGPVIALDVPGYGESDPLQVAEPSMQDYASALRDTFDALHLESAAIVGWGSGATMAEAFSRVYPERVTSVRMHDAVECSAEERDSVLANYALSLAPEWDGTHLVRAWMIRRDMHVFRPWFARLPAARLAAGLPSSDELHREFVDLLRAGNHWGDAERAAVRYTAGNGDQPPEQLRHMASHFTRGYSGDAERAAVRYATAIGDTPFAEAQQLGHIATHFARGYADTSFGQVHLRRAGPRGGIPLLMLHASPGSARGVLPLASRLAANHDVVAMDTPGFGDSDPLPAADPSIRDFADAVLEVADSLGAPRVDLYGTHTGASIALETAVRGASRIRKLVFDGLPMFSTDERVDHLAHYIPPFEAHWDGSHVVWAWNFIRNMTLFYPWYHMDARHATGRAPDALLLHERVVDLMKAGPNYASGYRAVYRYDPRPALEQLSAQTMLCVSQEDVLAHHAEAVRSARPDVRITWLPGADRINATAAAMHEFLG
jgi:pimeloyl-ACP methyl ester carboxylesterase